MNLLALSVYATEFPMANFGSVFDLILHAHDPAVCGGESHQPEPLLGHPAPARLFDALLHRPVVPGYPHTDQRSWSPGSSAA
jgi:hypothetical protein